MACEYTDIVIREVLPGFVLRPLLSAAIAKRLEKTVSKVLPGYVLRPLLSEDNYSFESTDQWRVAGVCTPAFVERRSIRHWVYGCCMCCRGMYSGLC